MKSKAAIKKINELGILLVFPINNKPEPNSIWREFYPRKKMIWEWDAGGDASVGDMWLLMKHLSDCGHVVYSKWYQGRATFFSKELFTATLCLVRNSFPQNDSELALDMTSDLTFQAKQIFEVLESDSPLSTKEIKKLTDLKGKDNEAIYSRALKSLFLRQLIVAYGEVDDGAFPSLAVGSTQVLFEDLWIAARGMKVSKAQRIVDRDMPKGSLMRKFFDKNISAIICR